MERVTFSSAQGSPDCRTGPLPGPADLSLTLQPHQPRGTNERTVTIKPRGYDPRTASVLQQRERVHPALNVFDVVRCDIDEATRKDNDFKIKKCRGRDYGARDSFGGAFNGTHCNRIGRRIV